MSDVRHTPPIVKPRKPYDESRCILAIAGGLVFVESTGELHDYSELPRIVATEPGSIVACENAARILMDLNERFSDLPFWSWRVTPVTRRRYRQHAPTNRPTMTKDAVVNYFGFRYVNETNGRAKSYYHYPIDVLTFLSGNLASDFYGDATTDVERVRRLYDWGCDVREFCRQNRMKISSTSGGLAAQLLRDPRFFKEPRRKVPKATNARVRDHLPGNHYELFVPENTSVQSAYYLDMKGAHHYVASRTTFPSPNSMYGRGAFRNPPETHAGREVWARAGTRKFQSVITTHGLFLLRIVVPSGLTRPGSFPPPWLRGPSGIRLAWVYSNEFPLLTRHRVTVEGVEAAWTSSHPDDSLNSYARFAIAETAVMTEDRKRWAKSTLLAVYGLLAARPQPREFGYRTAKKGEAKVYPTFGGMLEVQALTTSREIESPIVNVILRGMIEAGVRMEVLSLATDLHARGVKILSLYADSVIVEPTAALPLLPPPWSVKTELSKLTFFNPVSFMSNEMEKLPGITPEGRHRNTLRSVWRATLSGVASRRTPDGPPVPWSANRVRVIEVDNAYRATHGFLPPDALE